MKKIVVLFGAALCSGLASAQWAVLDESVRLIVQDIRDTGTNGGTDLNAFNFEQHELSAKFEAVAIADPTKYIGTAEDCGDEKINKNHYNACMGLRRLRLKTLEQTQSIIKTIQDRRATLKTMISDGIGLDKAGVLQKKQFALAALQAEMQNDAMELEALRYGYKQRETMYEMQMAEARRATDTRAPSGPGGFKITLPVPFPGK